MALSSLLVDATQVIKYLDLPSGHLEDMEPVVLAVSALVSSYHDTPDEGEDWPENIKLGAVMLAARVYRRRNSPAGVESLGEMGPVYISRNDPDLAQLLQIGRYAVPRVG